MRFDRPNHDNLVFFVWTRWPRYTFLWGPISRQFSCYGGQYRVYVTLCTLLKCKSCWHTLYALRLDGWVLPDEFCGLILTHAISPLKVMRVTSKARKKKNIFAYCMRVLCSVATCQENEDLGYFQTLEISTLKFMIFLPLHHKEILIWKCPVANFLTFFKY